MGDEAGTDLTMTVIAEPTPAQLAAMASAIRARREADRTQAQRVAQHVEETLSAAPRKIQTTLDSQVFPLEPVLVDMEHEVMFNPYTFFMRWLWNSKYQLRDGQVDFTKYVQTKLSPLVGRGWAHGCIFEMPTGAGKSIAIDYLSVLAAATHARPTTGRRANMTVILAVPTVALAQEAHARLYDCWNAYGYHTIRSGARLRVCPRIKVAAVRGERKFALVPIKLLAGQSDAQGIMVRASRNDDEAAKGQGSTGQTDIAYVCVCTYEHALQLLQAHDQTLTTRHKTKLGEHIGAVVFDEAHYITESSRSAAHALHVWTMFLDVPTVYMTATPGLTLWQLIGSILHVIRIASVRKSPIASVQIQTAGNEVDIWNILRPLLVSHFLAWHVDRRIGHLGVFVENKGALKMLFCALYVTLRQILNDPRMPSCDPILDDSYLLLSDMLRADMQSSPDEMPYGIALNDNYTAPFREACSWLMDRGVHLTTGDMSNHMRRAQSRIYTRVGEQFAMVMSTSALAEGVNISGLRMLVVGVIMSGNDSFLTQTKVMQMVGRLDREDVGGIALVPPPTSLKNTSPVVMPNNILVDVIGRPIVYGVFDSLMALGKMDAVPGSMSFLDEPEIDRMIGTVDTTKTLAASAKKYRCWGLIPYMSSVGLHAYAVAVYRKKSQTVCVTAFAKLLRYLGQDDVLPMHVFSYHTHVCALLGGLPPAACILIPLLFARKTRISPADSIRSKKISQLEQFIEAPHALMTGDHALWQLHNRILNVVSQMASEATVPAIDRTGFVGYKWQLFAYTDIHLEAFATYTIDFLNCQHDIDCLTGLWSTYAEFTRGMPAAFDYVVAVLSEDVTLPILRAEHRFWRKPTLSVLAGNGLAPGLIGPETAHMCMFKTPSSSLHGYRVPEMPDRREALQLPTIAASSVIENHMLIVMSAAARVLTRCLKPDTEPTFAQARQALATGTKRSYTDSVTKIMLDTPLTTSPGAKTRRQISDEGLDANTPARALERYMGTDWWGRMPVTPYTAWDKMLDDLVSQIESDAKVARQKFEEAARKAKEDVGRGSPG
jgi:hypothetical protein